jgi:hypothetical protein
MKALPKKVWVNYTFPSKNDFGGDYCGVEVVFDGKVVETYGDYYHDKGDAKAEAFIAGFFAAHEQPVPAYEAKNRVDKTLS